MENFDNNDDELIVREPIAAYGKKIFTIEEYLEFENASPERYEYYKGEIFAMAGASENHCAINMNLNISLGIALKKSPCKPWGNDLRLHIPSNTFFTYPDIRIACKDSLPNSDSGANQPNVIIEILSKSTQNYDRGKKFELYKDIPSLQEYILVDSEKPAVDIYRKTTDNTWELRQYTKKDRSIEIKVLGIKISFKRIYEDIQLKENPNLSSLRSVKGKMMRA